MPSINPNKGLFMLLSPIIKVSQNNATRMTARAVVSLLCQTWRQKEVSSSPEQAAQHEWYRILSDAYHRTLGVKNNILSLRGAPRQSNPFLDRRVLPLVVLVMTATLPLLEES
jgi:hypothetical protein